MLAALAARQRRLSPKYFYDEAGSALFDLICDLPEYYPTRTELALLSNHAGEIARHMGPNAEIVEFGAGSLRKIRLLLDAMDQPLRYLPIDISGAHLATSAARLQADYPGLGVVPVVADYTRAFQLPSKVPGGGRRIGFFPGSTLGNLSQAGALRFLKQAARLLRGGALLVGVDLVKAPSTLHAAYNDSRGVTAAFNLNVLERANRELDADFNVSQFAHSAFYNAPLQRIEMHLMSRRAQQVHVCGESFSFAEGETLHTENSHKFTVEGLRALAVQAGFRPGPAWTDPQKLFSLHWLRAPF
ncbi:L-histidine N(alpha)-methyltransferase [Paralcaligenes sp. KSB-10]|uniref:L-histidine N(alpha)-methyltransferase n=1 Tax=Paralcaligenes sp. KSB-10 TaxID=2901142 RepID=UPI001E3EF8D4|nr:L-histidine N(alpha)-methyltransferase [Paralcaligenes sp. KSB-10]UHL66205.1 L-histidine N(alpha)-methyltransferase [Paralcaligenes sp. KSB-10]